MNQKKRKPFDLILFAVVVLLFAVVLEMSKNTLAGWVIFAGLAAVFILLRLFVIRGERWSAGRVVMLWVCFAALLLVDLKLTEPPYKNVPAVEASSPGVTEVVSIPQGKLTGVLTEDGEVEVYAGIPYAAPPVGELRFREPQEPESWEGVRACDTFAPMAMQQRSSVIYSSLRQILGTHNYRITPYDNYREPVSEDCLYLNIWKSAKEAGEPLPVLLYIHGGSLMTGQSYDPSYRGEAFARRGVIVVNCSYRLGVFGYFASEELEAESPNGTTGDYGLLDQIAALKWVHDNIEYFGGDPERITIAGESAGASSINALCASPLTKGLFQYAIAESSGIVPKHPYHTFREREEALEMGKNIMEEMGVSTLEELRALPAEKLIQTSWRNDSMMVDGYAITKQPYLTYMAGENNEKALLNGFNLKEADAFLLNTEATMDNYVELLRDIAGDYSEELAEVVPPGSVTRDQTFIIDKGGDAKGSLCYAYSAAWFSYSHHVWSNAMVMQGKPVYEYFFTKTNGVLSNNHAGELPYAYGNLWRVEGAYDEADFELSEMMQSYWVNFIKTGDPNGAPESGGTLPVWEPRDDSDELLMEFNEAPAMIRDPYLPVYEVLDKYMDSL